MDHTCEKLESRIIHAGYLPSRAEYLSRLRGCDIVVSTAIQEFCGLAVIEAMLCGCQPLLPDRLAYPELIPQSLRDVCLYRDDNALEIALRECVEGQRRLARHQHELLLSGLMKRFGAKAATARIDDALSHLVKLHRDETCSLGLH